MIYIFDSNTLIDLFKYYYLERFPTLWEKFDEMVANKKIVSVSEVGKELEDWGDRLSNWVKNHRQFFLTPTKEELNFVAEIFKNTHFQAMLRKKELLQGKPVADPFIIAKAKISKACVVTQEKFTKNAARIPNVCAHFSISCLNLEGFMEKENWTF